MIKVRMFKMPFATKHFNKNQKVWIQSLSGSQAARCIGKFRGKSRYVMAWVNWSSTCKENPAIKEFDVSKEFAKKVGLTI